MPAISHDHALERRAWSNTVGQSGMTPTAFAFLIPVFVVVVFCPFLLIFCIRRRQRAVTQPAPRKVKKPALRRAEARERLKQVTDVSNITSTEEKKAPHNGLTEEREQAPAVTSTPSISEQECAICLSTLHAPSPPEPALLATSSTVDEAAVNPSAVDDSATNPPSLHKNEPAAINPPAEPEAILKLHTCSHTFHAECLVSWFVLRKTTCPICRAPYISKEDMLAYEEEEVAATAVPEQMTVVDNVNVAGNARGAHSVSNWRYFWAGQSVLGREHGDEEARRGNAVTETEQDGGSGGRFWRNRR